MAQVCVAMRYTPAQYFALTIAERAALITELNKQR